MFRKRYWSRESILLFLFAFWAFSYFALNHITSFRPTIDFSIALDYMIPFIPFFVYFYVLAYPLAFMPYFFVDEIRDFRRVAAAYSFTVLITCTVFIFFPGTIIRPDFVADSFAGHFLVWLRSIAKPHNLLPSLHVSLSFLSAFIIRKHDKLWGWFFIFIASLVLISTLFIKQHYILDTIVGGILAGFIYKTYYKRK